MRRRTPACPLLPSFGYDADGRRTSLVLPNGLSAAYNYDQASQLRGIVFQGGALGVANLNYSYDLDGRRTGVSGTLASRISPRRFRVRRIMPTTS